MEDHPLELFFSATLKKLVQTTTCILLLRFQNPLVNLPRSFLPWTGKQPKPPEKSPYFRQVYQDDIAETLHEMLLLKLLVFLWRASEDKK